ncbi:MAG: hypothetical protein IT282_18550 [Bacteroidetes bacterium]|nr:hypothetical protein [Bacteroidota bacterium]
MGSRHAWIGLLTCAVLCWTAPGTVGQTKPEPPRHRPVMLPRDTSRAPEVSTPNDSANNTRTRFPTFDVPEYTITGEETSGLSRMPRPLHSDFPAGGALRSAGPGMRTPVLALDDTRRPTGLYDADRIGGGARLGYGSFQSPSLDLWLSYGADQTDFLLNSGFTSSRGHVPHAQSQRAFNTLSGGFGLLGTRVRATLGLNGDGYRLYGSDRPDRWRTVTDIRGDVEIGTVHLGGGGLSSGMHMRSTVLEDTLKSSEVQLGFDASYRVTLGRVRLIADAVLSTSSYTSTMDVLSPHLYTMGIRARFPVQPMLDMEAGVRAGVRRGTDMGALGFVDPLFGVYWRGWTDATAYVRFEPSVEKASLLSMSTESPYVTVAPHLRPRHYRTNLVAGVTFRPAATMRCTVEWFTLRGDDVPVFVDRDSAGIWTPVYGGVVRSTGVTASIAADLSQEDVLHATLTLRNARWSGTGSTDPLLAGDAVPYVPGLEIDAFALHRFPFGLSIAPSLRLVGSRAVDPRNSRSLTSYLDIGLRAEYIVLPSFTIALTFENLFGTKRTYWDRYPGVPATAALSAAYSW